MNASASLRAPLTSSCCIATYVAVGYSAYTRSTSRTHGFCACVAISIICAIPTQKALVGLPSGYTVALDEDDDGATHFQQQKTDKTGRARDVRRGPKPQARSAPSDGDSDGSDF